MAQDREFYFKYKKELANAKTLEELQDIWQKIKSNLNELSDKDADNLGNFYKEFKRDLEESLCEDIEEKIYKLVYDYNSENDEDELTEQEYWEDRFPSLEIDKVEKIDDMSNSNWQVTFIGDFENLQKAAKDLGIDDINDVIEQINGDNSQSPEALLGIYLSEEEDYDVDSINKVDWSEDVYDINEGEMEYLVIPEDKVFEKVKDNIIQSIDDCGGLTCAFTDKLIDELLSWEDAENYFKDLYEQEKSAAEGTEDEYLYNDELDNYVQFYIDELGYDYVKDELNANWQNIFDIDDIVDTCIDWDGAGHFLAYYDGKEIDLDNNYKAYRIN